MCNCLEYIGDNGPCPVHSVPAWRVLIAVLALIAGVVLLFLAVAL